MALLLFLSLLGLASSSLISVVPIDQSTAEYIAHNSNAAAGVCVDVKFRYCQVEFAKALNLPETVTWQNASLILQTIQNYADANITEMLTLCSVRAKYYQCLGAQYYGCVSLYNLLNKNGATVSAAYTYVDALASVDFICNTGFEEAANQYSCLQTVALGGLYKGCITDFQAAIAGHPENLCREVRKTGRCMNDVYTNACQHDPKGAGWFGCESFSSSFGESCWERDRCYVH